MHKQNRNRLRKTENRLVIVTGEEGGGVSEVGEGDSEGQAFSYKIN